MFYYDLCDRFVWGHVAGNLIEINKTIISFYLIFIFYILVRSLAEGVHIRNAINLLPEILTTGVPPSLLGCQP